MEYQQPRAPIRMRRRGLAVAAGLALAAESAGAQTTPAATPSQAVPAPDTPPSEPVAATTAQQAGTDVVVTGTRVARAGYTAPTPTTIVGIEQIQKSAPANVADYLNQLPQLLGSATPRSPGLGSSNTSGANILNLRNLGPLRTLVLLDGHRIAPSVITGSVDANLVPQGLIQRVDIVTGGASADWGSDAVAGVVNFVLNTKFTGLKVDVQSGVSEYGDGANRQATVTFGTAFAGGRGHLVANAEYSDVGSGDVASSRAWFQGYKIITNPAYVAGNGQPQLIVAPHVGLSLATTGGLITAGPLKGTQFVGSNGTPTPFNFGFVSGQLSVGGDAEDFGASSPLQQPVTNYNGYVRASYDIFDHMTAYADFIYGKTSSLSTSVPYMRFGNITISAQNAYLDNTTKTRLAAAGATSFAFGTTNENIGFSQLLLQRELKQGTVGLSGSFGKTWSWDVSYQHGQTDFLQQNTNPIVANYNAAVDAVVSPTTGQIVCRSTLTNPGNGCVPLNVFGLQELTPAQRAYVVGTASQPIKFLEDVAAASLRGEPFSIWAGPVSIAAGIEYRTERFRATSDPLSQAISFYLGNYQPSEGGFNVKEGFFETVVPLLRNVPLAKSIDFNGAVRITDYNTSGTVVTWKVGATWDVVSGLRLRGTRSRDIRAPNSAELFRANAYQAANYFDPFTNTTVSGQTITRGNTSLTPELGDTISGGLVFRPTWLSGFSASIDYYRISISNSITTPTAQQVLTQCFAGVTILCSDIIRNGTGQVTQVIAQPTNVQNELERGIDIETSYRWDLANRFPSIGGIVTLRALASYVDTRRIVGFGTVVDYAGTNDDSTAVPHWRATGTVDYSKGPFNTTLTTRFIGGGIETNVAPLIDHRIPSVAYFDLYGSYRIGTNRTIQLYFVVQNLLDKDPPAAPALTPSYNLISNGTNGFLYDLLGRQFRVGARVNF